MLKPSTFHLKLSSPLLFCLSLAVAFLFAMGAPATAWANCYCDDGYCESVSRAYFEFGERIDENCHFTADVSRPSGAIANGFTVGANGITIDGAGFCLDGVTKDSPVIKGTNGIYAGKSAGAYDVTIKNLEIKNFWQGIKLRGNGDSDPITGMVVDNCVIHDNGVSGDDAKYEGIWLDVAQNCTVTNCEIYNNNQGSGIANGEGDYNTFTYNTLYNNYKQGIKAWWDSWYITSAHNTAHDNGYGGINQMSGSNYGTIEYNTSYDNCGPGITAGGDGNLLQGNISTDNVNFIDPVSLEDREDGIGIDCTPDDLDAVAYLYDNTACGNEEYDIFLGDDVTGIGENNTCTTYYNYSDPGTVGCANPCEGDLPIAKFYADDTMVCAGSVQFHDQSLCAGGSTLTWAWDFGDGGTSPAQDPVHTYTGSGIYSVTLTVTMTGGESGTDSVTREDYITVCPFEGDLEPVGDPDGDVDGADYYTFYVNCIVGDDPDGWCDSADMSNLGLMDCLSCQ